MPFPTLPFGRRIQKASSAGTVIFVYDGANIVEELNAAGTVTAQYAQGAGIDEPLASNLGGTLAFYEADGLGSITSLTDNAGSAVAAYIRDSFGKPISTADTLGNRFRYTGREWDEETGLYYYRARYYDTGIGRFASEDPIGFGGWPTLSLRTADSGLPHPSARGWRRMGVCGVAAQGQGDAHPFPARGVISDSISTTPSAPVR